MWSIGCIFAEFYTFSPIFKCRNEHEALDKAFKMLGSPNNHHSPHLLELKKFKEFTNLSHYPIQPLSVYFPQIDNPLALDLLGKLIALDPRKRITAKEALRHEFFKQTPKKNDIFDLKHSKFMATGSGASGQ